MIHPAHSDYHGTWFNRARHGPALPFLAVAAISAQALGSIAQGQQEKKAADYNARVQENNAKIAEQNARFAGEEGAANAATEAMKTRAAIGGIKAAQAANGVDINSGSPVDVRSSAAELGELNAITIRNNAARHAYGYQTEASSDRAQAQLDRQQGKYAAEAGFFKAGTTVLGSGISAYQAGTFDSWMKSTSLNGESGGGYGTDYAGS